MALTDKASTKIPHIDDRYPIGPLPFGILLGSKYFWIQLAGADPQSNYLGRCVRWDGSVLRSSDFDARSEYYPAKQLGSTSA
jgi:hypothetical protein